MNHNELLPILQLCALMAVNSFKLESVLLFSLSNLIEETRSWSCLDEHKDHTQRKKSFADKVIRRQQLTYVQKIEIRYYRSKKVIFLVIPIQ